MGQLFDTKITSASTLVLRVQWLRESPSKTENLSLNLSTKGARDCLSPSFMQNLVNKSSKQTIGANKKKTL